MLQSKKDFNAVKRYLIEVAGYSYTQAILKALGMHSLWLSETSVEVSPFSEEEEEIYEVHLYYDSLNGRWIGTSPNDGGMEEYDSFIKAEQALIDFGMYRVG